MINIALISPNENAYSETFIQQHKNHLKGNVVYYYKGKLPIKNNIEGEFGLSRLKMYTFKIKNKIKKGLFSIKEQALVNSFKNNKIQIVVAEFGQTGVSVLKICKFLNLPIIPIFHGYDASVKEILESNKYNYKELIDYSSSVLAVSNKIKKTLIDLSDCNQDKIKVSPCSPNPNFINLNPCFLENNFVSVGRFVDKKAPYYIILAFSEVLKKYDNVHLKIVGEGYLLNTCKNLVNYLNLEKNIELTGRLSPEQIRQEFEKSIGYVQHSIVANNGDSEGTPVAVLEAGLSALPVISTFHAGIPDVILNNETGFLVKEHDVNEMANKIIFLIENKKIAKDMGVKSRKYIAENFSLVNHINTINKMIKDAVIEK